MQITAGQVVTVTRDQTGADGKPASNTHTAVLWKNGATTAVSVTRANPSTGVYSFSFTVPVDAVEADVFSLRVVDGDGYPSTVWEGCVAGAVELDSSASAKLARIEAVVSGTLSGAGTDTETFVGPSATVVITVDASGNRSNVSVT